MKQSTIDGFAALHKAMQNLSRAVDRASKRLSGYTNIVANDEVRVAGLSSRYYVRGGLACHSATDVNVLVQGLLHADYDAYLMTPANRALLAAKTIEGYVVHNDAPAPVVNAWYRWYRNTEVVVARGAA